MNNVWSSIALRGYCSSWRARAKPLLHLFSGYTKSQCPRNYARPILGSSDQHLILIRDFKPDVRTISTTSYLGTKKGKAHRSKANDEGSQPQFNSKIERAPTAASHTEGLPSTEGADTLIWRDYDPVGGMPLPHGELTQAEINAVFDCESIDADVGNYTLSVMHWRRLSGSLIDVGLDFPKDSGVDRGMALKGLAYIRKIVPNVDESAAGQTWAAEESERLQTLIQEKAVKLGIYKAAPETEHESDQGTEYGRQKSGQSALEQLRLEKEAAWEREQAEKEAIEIKTEAAALHNARGPLELGAGVQPSTQHIRAHSASRGVLIRPPEPKAWLQPVERKPWVKYYEEQASIIKEKVVPQVSFARHLGPPLLVLCLVLAGCYYLGDNYSPPPKSSRMWPETPPAVATLSVISTVLVLSFVMGRMPPLWKAWNTYMTIIPTRPHPLSLLGATLRHDTLRHLTSNLVTLWLFGLLLHEDVGRGNFVAIYLASGVVGGYVSLLNCIIRKHWATYIFGVSNCVFGVFAAACTLRPSGHVRVFGYDVPIAAWVFMVLAAGGEVFAAARGVATMIDHAGHLGGIVTGVVTGMLLRAKQEHKHPGAKMSDAVKTAEK